MLQMLKWKRDGMKGAVKDAADVKAVKGRKAGGGTIKVKAQKREMVDVPLPVRIAGTVGYLAPLAVGAAPAGVLWALPVLPALLLIAVRKKNMFLASHLRTSVNIQLWYLIGMFAGFGVLASSPAAGSVVGLIDLGVSAAVSSAASLLWLAGPFWGVFRLWGCRKMALPRPFRLLHA